MASTRPRCACALLPALTLLLCIGVPVFSRDGETKPASLATEIGNIERSLEANLTGAERREACINLARLRRLSGDVAAAARAWREAALADPGNPDGQCFLESSLCYLALGEFDAASDALLGVIAGSDAEDSAFRDARYVSAQIEVFRSGSVAPLYALLSQPEYAEYRPAIYYTFWRLFGDEAYKTQIATEFPDSPEARILQNEAALASAGSAAAAVDSVAGGAVSARSSPLWFFYPGRGNIVMGPPVPLQPAAVPRQHEPSPAAAEGPRALQTGLFSREENAHASANRLAAKGFAATVSRKLVNGVVYWAVSVAPGENSNRTIMRLKDAGFESFPVF